jgi:hypothetical protein
MSAEKSTSSNDQIRLAGHLAEGTVWGGEAGVLEVDRGFDADRVGLARG